LAAVIISLSGCASFATSNLLGPGNYYSDTVTVGAVRGEASSKVWFGILGKEDYPSVERVAKENNINKIATVEHYSTMGIFGLWMDYKTIVTGE
jgi:hypothetical protein